MILSKVLICGLRILWEQEILAVKHVLIAAEKQIGVFIHCVLRFHLFLSIIILIKAVPYLANYGS